MKNYEILRSDVKEIIGDKFSWYNDKYRLKDSKKVVIINGGMF
jgi:hypothetical protein